MASGCQAKYLESTPGRVKWGAALNIKEQFARLVQSFMQKEASDNMGLHAHIALVVQHTTAINHALAGEGSKLEGKQHFSTAG